MPPACPDALGAPGGGGGNGRKGGHGKGKLIRKQPAKKRQKGMPKKKTVTPAIPLVRKTDWEVLMWFDSEAAARVSGVAETVDYFG